MAPAIIEKDLVVLGSGPGGYIAAIRAAQLGRKVSIIEREALGGICLNWGCIPTKALLKTAHLFSEMQHAESYGIEAAAPKPNFDKIISRSRDVASKLSAGVTYLMKKNKVEVLVGNGKILPGKKLEISSPNNPASTISFKDIIIATGARAKSIPGIEVDGKAIPEFERYRQFYLSLDIDLTRIQTHSRFLSSVFRLINFIHFVTLRC